MHNLVNTIECIYRVARGIKIDLTVSDEQYENNVEIGLRGKEYSIPSLIWPPPETDNNYYHHTPIIVSSDFLIKGDSTCL